ncbi:hypothetical protein [Pseudomonas sp. UMAB-40]|uniref:hypothetical protein n=1 Tax=Pseudomonas sp. UMAB-40 TaxID=1365407 RepID=UPI001C5818CE|nr:hypothetical protein [Pseudomonas sp. UMAB-40]
MNFKSLLGARPDKSLHNPDAVYMRALVKASGLTQAKAAADIDISERAMRNYLSQDPAKFRPAPYAVQYTLEQMAATPVPPAFGNPEVVAVIGETNHASPETDVIHLPGIDALPVGTELVDRAHVTRLQAELQNLRDMLVEAADGLQNYAEVADSEFGKSRAWEQMVADGEADETALKIRAYLSKTEGSTE